MRRGIAMREFLRLNEFRVFAALVAALAVVSLGLQADVAWADDPGGEDIDVPAPAPAPAPPPPPPPADEDNFHLYVSGNVAGGFPKGRAGGSIAGFPNNGKDRDDDVFGGGSLGLHYDGGPVGVRFEWEGQAGRGANLDTNWGPLGAGPMDTTVNSWAMLWNLWLDFPLTESFSIFGGGGMGFSVTDMTSKPAFLPLVGGATDGDTNWAWQVGGGISIKATDWLAFDTSYRFIDLGEPDLDYRGAVPFPSDLRMHLQSHDVMLGVRMNFLSF
jgi:opacity protein-like surface antigen